MKTEKHINPINGYLAIIALLLSIAFLILALLKSIHLMLYLLRC
ncbi:hypothetical protein HNP25_004222 [Arcicella rosea]|uniref:Uncharacterized protein n=1 Tax=Arcicella rosea TaxID=502909 RepID=A0A841EY48_9BACT|nr:hypothetical protein [Arcicella rosea]